MPDLVRAAWLQSMLIHRSVTDKQGRELYQAACQSVNCEFIRLKPRFRYLLLELAPCFSTSLAPVPYESAQFDDFVHEASVSVSGFGLEVRRMPDPWSGRGVIALVSGVPSETACRELRTDPLQSARSTQRAMRLPSWLHIIPLLN